ncbi:MAG: hypothetical protein EOO50_13410 [Flavobacterium sp.]|uniref:hypothetical protein n=1 Tax=Flavobacterium sp. TaxID=239 RepID=UPI00120C9290|nr:hypothetical protein [Flavobacterium sp.]RZJ65539.1 MAG: hypothetical protein EOO50_13410 [Flavobacterium sp.]
MKARYLTIALAALAISCGDSDNGGGSGNPGEAALIAPINNSECITGTSVSTTQSKVTFEWNPAENADTYFVYVKNLLTQSAVQQFNAGDAVTLEVTLQKGVPYSWYVSAKNEGGGSMNSATWKFYNAGEGVTNYAPFPAEATFPGMSATVTGPSITLQWEASDIDNDIASYKIYMDTNANPTTLKATVSAPELAGVAVTGNTTFYWKIVTTDAAGNSSTSPVFQFKTN